MGRSDLHRVPHIREEKPPAAPPARAPDPAEAGAPAPEGPEGRGWGVAILVWAAMLLFLAALMLFDLVAGLFRK
jgi:hypothetical protein